MALIRFRPTTPADEPAIIELLRSSFGMALDHPMIERHHVHWKYWEPREDWEGSRSYALTKDGTIVAHAAVVPCDYLHGGLRKRFIQVIDWAARSDVRGAGAAIMQHIAKLADAIVTANGSEFALPILPFIGFKPSGTTVRQYVRPIRPLLRLAGATHLTWRLVPQFMRNVFWALNIPSVPDRGWRARRLEGVQIAEAAIPWPEKLPRAAIFARTPALMSYVLRCPAAPMQFHAIENQGRVRGYIVLTIVPGQARIADIWVDSDDAADWRAAVHLAVQQAKENRNVAEVAAIASESMLDQALVQCGFHSRLARPLLMRPDHMATAELPVRVQMLDDDSAYLHDGASRFWA